MKRIAAAATLIGMLVAAAAYNIRVRNAPPPAPTGAGAPDEAVPVTVVTATRTAAREDLALIGILRPERQAAITPMVPGRIESVLVRAGDRVRKGQPLVRMHVGDWQAQIRGAEAGVAAADAQYRKAIDGRRARQIELDAAISQATAGLATALARRRQAELSVPLTRSAAVSDADRAEAGYQQAEAGVRQAEIGLKLANETLERLKKLYERGGIARVDLEGAQAQADIARAQYDSALAALQQARAGLIPAKESQPMREKVSQVDVEAANAGVRQAEEGVRNARRARAEALKIADRDVEAARAQVEMARAGLAQARAQIGGSLLLSPFDAIVTEVFSRAGEYAQPGMPILHLSSARAGYIEAAAPARYAALLRVGLPARITLDTQPNRPLRGTVQRILPLAGSDNRTFPIQITFAQQPDTLNPGVMGRVEIELIGDPNAIRIPTAALRNEGNRTYVLVIAYGKAARREVTLGATHGEMAQAIAGLKEGETVILSAPSSLQPGMAVKPIPSPNPPRQDSPSPMPAP
jgi:RND family efflux transporter MFP subunit